MKSPIGIYVFWGPLVLALAATVSAQTSGNQISKGAGTPSYPASLILNSGANSAKGISDGSIEAKREALATTTQEFVPDIYKPFKESYYKTVEIIQLSWPLLVDGTDGRFGGRLAVGLNHPSYTFKKELSLVGTLDLNIDGVIGGVVSSARITISYNFRRPYTSNDTQMHVNVNNVSFKVGIPIGKW